jgi:two-component system nitrogen regulation response regulator GlnG
MSQTAAETILIIDDDGDLRYSLKRVLSSKGYHLEEASSGEEGIKKAQAVDPQLIFLDNRMGGMSGLETLQHLRGVVPKAMIVLMTAYGTTQTTIEAMKFGAFDYVMKPFDPKRIIALAESALAAARDLGKAEAASAKRVPVEDLPEQEIVGTSPSMQAVFKTIGQVAASDVTVMITGESGTGKELIARAIYQHSLRSKKPFIAVNCAAIPDNLIESELFGHEKGSFTGATTQRIGKFELCDGGTIFLDEIGDMALATQTKILRALQEGEIQRVGGSETIKVNVRLVAATNKPLEEMVKDKTFREDLYYRLNVVRIRLPALRERSGDIPQLIEFTLRRLARENKTQAHKISPEAIAMLSRYSWPGNVRELENVIYRSAVMAQGETILIKDLPAEIVAAVAPDGLEDTATVAETDESTADTTGMDSSESLGVAVTDTPVEAATPGVADFDRGMDEAFVACYPANEKLLLEIFEKAVIKRMLQVTEGNQVEAAKVLGITRATLKKRIDLYEL